MGRVLLHYGTSVALLASLVTCTHRDSLRTVEAARVVRERRFRAPRAGCEAPAFPSLSTAWVVVGWPGAPRFTSVESEGAALYATTGAAVCRSLDGGRHWSALLTDLDAPVLAAVDGARIVVRAEEAWSDRETVDVTWWVSENAGVDWTRTEHLPSVGEGHLRRVRIQTREFNGEYNVVTCGDAYFAVVPPPRGRMPVALRSLDGGVRWTRLELPVSLRAPGMTFRCIGHDAVAVERGGAVPLVTGFSRDRGTRWEAVVRVPSLLRNAEGFLDSDVYSTSGCAPISRHGVFCEVHGQAWATTNLGRRWHRATSPVGGRALAVDGEYLVGVGGGVAVSNDAGRQWEMVTVSAGRANLGIRGGVVSATSYWLAGTALWWSDDGGERWTATQLPWQLVAVLGRERWVGLRSSMSNTCDGVLMLTTNGGATWTPVSSTRMQQVAHVGDMLYARACATPSRVYVSHDGQRWRVDARTRFPDEDTDDARAADGTRAVLRDGVLSLVRGNASERVATGWPRDIVPITIARAEGVSTVIVFGNGTVLRRL